MARPPDSRADPRALRRLGLGLALALAGCAGGAGPAGSPGAAVPPAAPAPPAPAAADPWASERPAYRTPAELCRYVNAMRERGADHQRYRGVPGRGSYHDAPRTWPLAFAPEPALDREAQAEADRLAREGGPRGTAVADSSWRRPIWIDGLGSERYRITARDEPGDWHPRRSVAARAAFIASNGSVRQALLHQDPGGTGPVLARIGCGGALAVDGRARWWVVVLGP